MATLKIGLAQLNSTVGELDGNLELIVSAARDAHDAGCHVLLTPEMALTGYPLEDLVLRSVLQQATANAEQALARRLEEEGLGALVAVIGSLGTLDGKPTNDAVIITGGEVLSRYHKRHLPTYGVFDEGRVFKAGTDQVTVEVEHDDHNTRIAIAICEDLWQASDSELIELTTGADVIASLNASPFESGKVQARHQIIQRINKLTSTPVAYVNAVGTQDELIFDGHSFVSSGSSSRLEGPGFKQTVLVSELDVETGEFTAQGSDLIKPADALTRDRQLHDIYFALVQSVYDFVTKIGLSKVGLGLSGGIDSALVAAIAVDALGPENVFAVAMPSEYSSGHSVADAEDLAVRTGLNLRTIPIAKLLGAFGQAAGEVELDLEGLPEENLQARIRGVLLMAMSNAEHPLILATGNKSELAVGYSTIYGDAVGGYAPLKDVYKTTVWELATWRNSHTQLFANPTRPIPENSITKPPSAELRPGQLDSDSLPDYELLDGILERYIEKRMSAVEIASDGFDPDLVAKTIAMTDLAEYKRRQYPPGPKISTIAFGRDRRLPITNHWSD